MSEDNASSQTRQKADQDELKRLFDMLDHTTFRNTELLKQKNELSQALAAREERFEAIKTELDNAQAALDARSEQASQLERLVSETRAALAARQSALEEARQNLADQQQQLDSSNEALIEREGQLRAAHAESAEFRATISHLELQKSELAAQIKQLQDDYAALQSRLRQREEEVEQTLAELRQLDKRLAEALARGKSTDEEVGQLKRDLAKRTQNLERLQERQVRLKAEKAKLAKDLAESEGWVFKLAGERGESERKLARAEREMVRQTKLHQQEIQQSTLLAQQLDLAKERALKAEKALRDREFELEDLRQRLAVARSHADGLERRLEDAERRAIKGVHLQAEVEQSKALLAQRDSEIALRFEELAAVTRFLREAENGRNREILGDSLTSAIAQALNNSPGWWALLPSSMRQRKKYQRLRRQGLFDGERYLRIYPDVEAARMDPLDHFLKHGMAEGRTTAID